MTRTTPTRVPQLDLKAQYATIRREVEPALRRVCESGVFILGPEGAALEGELADYCGVAHAVGCASGSDALLLSLAGLGVGPGDEVVTVPFSFFSTAGSVARLGARAAFVDIEPRTFNLDPARLADYFKSLPAQRRPRTKALIPVHLFGQPADMDEISQTADKYEAPIIEDAAQALGADYRGRRAGGLGRTACFSFYPTKNLGAYGDAGLVTTDDDALAGRLRALRQHGGHDRYQHDTVGWNSRLDELQAAVLRVKFRRLEAWNVARQQHAARYDQLLLAAGLAEHGKTYPDDEYPVVIPHRAANRRHIFHQYVVRVRARDALRSSLREEGIEASVYYPTPLHLQKCFRTWGGRAGEFPESERAAREALALPLYPELTPEALEYVAAKVAAFYQRG
ncbi:MAG: DegT/DnrJ/EryC1/StrS family aminotransferase [Terriglobia bacterium]